MSNNYKTYFLSQAPSKQKSSVCNFTGFKKRVLKQISLLLLMLTVYSGAFAHAVQVAYSVLPNGFIRVYIEHWHGDQTVESLIHNGMSVGTAVGSNIITQQLNPTGAFNNTSWDSLPGGAHIIVLKKGPSANKYQDWAYYDFAPAACNIPLNIILNGGVSVVLSQEHTGFWPVTISGTFNDTAAPTLTVNSNTAAVPCGTSGAVVNFSVTAADNCSANPAITYSHAPGSFFPAGTTNVTAFASDEKGNLAQLTFPVTVSTNDIIPPVISVPSTLTFSNDSGTCGKKTSYTVTASDNCSSVTLTQIAGLASGSVFPVGTTINTFTAIDASGNSDTASFSVTISDTEAPKATVLAPVYASCSVTVAAPQATDTCEGLVLGTTTDAVTYSAQGSYSIIWKFSDSKGNTSTAEQQIIIKDTEKPTLASLPNIVSVCSATAVPPTAIDNCSGEITGTTSDPLTYSKPGIHQITWSFGDTNGNITIAKQYVIIRDVSAPSVATRNIVLQLNANGKGSVTEAEIDNGSTDNCTIASYLLDKKDFTTSDAGINTVTLYVTDANGNSGSKTAIVNVLNKSSVISAYPNPFTIQTTVNFTPIADEKNASLDLYNSKGIRVKNIFNGAIKACENFSLPVEGSDLNEGFYFFRFTTSKDVVNFKVIVQK